MDSKATVTLITVDDASDQFQGRSAMPSAAQSLRVIEVSKEAIRAALAELTRDVNDMLRDIAKGQDDQAYIDQLAVNVQATRSGSLHWIAGLGASIAGSMTVTFKVARQDSR